MLLSVDKLSVLLVARVGVYGAAVPAENIFVVEGGGVGDGRGEDERRLVAVHTSRARWGMGGGRGLPAAACGVSGPVNCWCGVDRGPDTCRGCELQSWKKAVQGWR